MAARRDAGDLGLEEGRMAQAVANGSQPEGRVRLDFALHAAEDLLAAHVEGAYGHFAVADLVEDAAVGAVMIFLARRIAAAEEHELGAVEADRLAAAAEHGGDLRRHLDVAGDHHLAAVEGRGRKRFGLEHLEVDAAVAIGATAAAVHLGAARTKEHGSFQAVDDNEIAAPRGIEDPVGPYDRGDLERASDDRGVRWSYRRPR